MISAKLVLTALFASVALASSSHFDLKKSKKTGTTLGIFTNHIYGGFKVAWFKPYVGSNVDHVSCGDHSLWKAKPGQILYEMLSTAKCHDGHFAVAVALNADRTFETLFLEFDTHGTLLHEHTVESFVKALHKFKAFDLVKSELPVDLPLHSLFLHLEDFYDKHPELLTSTGDADL
ncbi:signal peptide containing protein [Theileria equi strain WA]|uniref:Signal peptide containing protein n=1 Tax=Theileria equi strain WA TaxID=1537102 RepID=L1LBU2_THEEQ|nr:signal peptide containing protein [Theileria equi strain WA]EKX72907.1 signal peptide containing protein [Theileria equi strain WA]|eukprot:XP_004832359.1 signal peptide containing protein [Theileria equi strain WA]